MNKKNIISLLVLAILAVAIPLGLNLVRQQQTLKSSATEAPITFSGDNAEQRNGVWVVKDRTKPVTVTFTSPLGPPPVATGPAILRSVQSPTKKKVSFSFPSLVPFLPKGLVNEAHATYNGSPECGGELGYFQISDTRQCQTSYGNHKLIARWHVEPQEGLDPNTSCNIFLQGWVPGGGTADKTISNRCSSNGEVTIDRHFDAPLTNDGIYKLYVSNGAGWCSNVEVGNKSIPCVVTPPPQSCDNACGGWSTPGNCGVGCSSSQRRITRNCGSRTDCSSSQCNEDSSCSSTGGGSSNTYVDPGSGNAGQSFTVIATATRSCSNDISKDFGGGLTNCRGGCGDGGVKDGCSNSDSPKSDGKPYWWRWTCTGSTAGSYTARFNASGSSCSSSTGYTINASTVTATVDIKSNGSDSITIDHNASVNLTWTSSSNITSCTASDTWSGSKPANGNYSTGPLSGPSTKTYTLNCTGSGVTASDSFVVTVNAPPTQSCSITGDFNGIGGVDLADYDIWENAFKLGRRICDVNTDLVLFNTWKRKSQGL